MMTTAIACDDTSDSTTLSGSIDRIETFELDGTGLDRLLVITGAGDATIDTADIERIEVRAEIYGERTRVERGVADGTARIETRCEEQPRNCGVDYFVTMPADLAATVDTGSGEVAITGVDNAVQVATGSGEVDITGIVGAVQAAAGSGTITVDTVVGQSVDLETGSGTIDATGLDVVMATAETGSGSVEMQFGDTPPDSVTISAGSGSVTLAVPPAEYRVSTMVEAGEVVVDGITVVASAPRELAITTGSGNVSIHGHR
ncbi:MAG: DUF4097 family beta strand repeat-containing protein [Myxococcota bacterium]